MFAISGPAILGLVATVIGIATALGIAVAILFAHYKNQNKDILRKDIVDLNNRLSTVEESNVRLEKSEEDCKRRLAQNETTIATLTEAVTKAAAVAELTMRVDENHQAVMAKLNQLVGP